MRDRRIYALVAFTSFLALVSVLAYARVIPTEIKAFPFYDLVGHFVLFGSLGLLAHYAFRLKWTRVFGRMVPIGPTLAVIYACMDESLRVLSHARTFDLTDLFLGVLGIIVFTSVTWFIRNVHRIGVRFMATELTFFGLKELRSILFPLVLIFLFFISNYVSIPGLYRYDFLFLAAVLAQILLVVTKLETFDEAKTIFLFHIIGLCLELFKTSSAVGSWSYPEMGYLKIGTVPLYSGFMYAAVGSYIAQAWKIFKLRLENHPSYTASLILCALIYLNFFTNHFIYDFRMFLFVGILVLYYRTDVYFTPRKREYRMPLAVSFLLIGFFVWIAENIATFLGAWKYPGQIHEWHLVSLQKVISWFLLVIICFIVVAYLKYFKARTAEKDT